MKRCACRAKRERIRSIHRSRVLSWNLWRKELEFQWRCVVREYLHWLRRGNLHAILFHYEMNGETILCYPFSLQNEWREQKTRNACRVSESFVLGTLVEGNEFSNVLPSPFPDDVRTVRTICSSNSTMTFMECTLLASLRNYDACMPYADREGKRGRAGEKSLWRRKGMQLLNISRRWSRRLGQWMQSKEWNRAENDPHFLRPWRHSFLPSALPISSPICLPRSP